MIKFTKNKNRYLWMNNYNKLYTIGISDIALHARGLMQDLEEFSKDHGQTISSLKKWYAMRPKASSSDFFTKPCAGKNWMLVGDAAGHVHPATGRGIRFALWSAELAAQAILSSDLRLYDVLWRKEYGKELIDATRSKRLFYQPETLDTIVNFANKNQFFSNLAQEILIRNDNLNDIGKRLLRSIPGILFRQNPITKSVLNPFDKLRIDEARLN